jgi:hypothetical protein
VVGGIAAKFASNQGTHDAACAITANHIAGRHRLSLSLMGGVEAFERDGHHSCRTIRSARRRLNVSDPPRVVRLEFTRRSAHDIEIEIMDARLIQNDMWKLRQPVFHVLDTRVAHDVLGLPIMRRPKRRLVDPAGLFQHALAEPKGMEHFHRAAGDAVSLAEQHAVRFLFDDAGLDVGKRGQLRRKRQPCWPAADDQHIDLLGN